MGAGIVKRNLGVTTRAWWIARHAKADLENDAPSDSRRFEVSYDQTAKSKLAG